MVSYIDTTYVVDPAHRVRQKTAHVFFIPTVLITTNIWQNRVFTGILVVINSTKSSC